MGSSVVIYQTTSVSKIYSNESFFVAEDTCYKQSGFKLKMKFKDQMHCFRQPWHMFKITVENLPNILGILWQYSYKTNLLTSMTKKPSIFNMIFPVIFSIST